MGRSYFGRASAPRALGPSIMQPGPVELTTADRARLPWACYALRGLRSIFPGPLELERVSLGRAGAVFPGRAAPAVAGAAPPLGRASGPPPPGPPLPARIRPTGRPRPAPGDFPPGFRQGFPP